jgi:capsular exopolysaccharide synthesis family protein
MSRIYDALQRGASLEAPRRRFVNRGANGGPSVDPVEEGYQRIAQGILGQPGWEHKGAILVVSAVHGEGASTVAREIAGLLCRDGSAQAVLVDANLRTPSQHLAFRLERTCGLTELATRGLAPEAAVRQGVGSPVAVVTAGRPTGTPSAILGLPALKATLEQLRARYDWVILDGPPVTVYSDAAILAPLVDGVVLVVEAERTRWEVVSQAKRTLEESGARILGAVLNRQRYHIPPALYGRL